MAMVGVVPDHCSVHPEKQGASGEGYHSSQGNTCTLHHNALKVHGVAKQWQRNACKSELRHLVSTSWPQPTVSIDFTVSALRCMSLYALRVDRLRESFRTQIVQHQVRTLLVLLPRTTEYLCTCLLLPHSLPPHRRAKHAHCCPSHLFCDDDLNMDTDTAFAFAKPKKC